MGMNDSTKYINIYKNQYMHEYKDGNLIIDKTSCYKVSRELAFLVSYLPKEADKEVYFECLSSLGIIEFEDVFKKLIDLGILIQKQNTTFFNRLKKIVNRIFNPQIKIFSSEFQEAILNFIIRPKMSTKYNIKKDKLLKITLYSISCMFLIFFIFDIKMKANHTIINISIKDTFVIIFMVFTGIIFHEFGHSIMCYYCGIGLRPICFSVFLFYPVLFTNVSGIDELDLKQRILVNISGLFNQGIYMFILLVMFFITKYNILLICVNLLAYAFFWNFHPFIRTDGYWFFNDILYFTKQSKAGKIFDNIYYIGYSLFSIYLGYKCFNIIKSLYFYFIDFKNIRFNINLLVRLFYLYFVIIFVMALKERFINFYMRFFNKNKHSITN